MVPNAKNPFKLLTCSLGLLCGALFMAECSSQRAHDSYVSPNRYVTGANEKVGLIIPFVVADCAMEPQATVAGASGVYRFHPGNGLAPLPSAYLTLHFASDHMSDA